MRPTSLAVSFVRGKITTRRPSVCGAAGLLLLGACGGGGEAGGARHTVVDSRDNYDPVSLDPARSTDVPTARAVSYLFDGLTRFTVDGKVEPGLASRWDVSPDGLTYTFHLRAGVKFHDGKPFVARQVAQSFKRVLDPKTRSGGAFLLYGIQGARGFADGKTTELGVAAQDDSTVIIKLEAPLATFTKMMALSVASIVPDSVGENFSEHPVGTGPWKLVQWKHDDYLKFARNESYFDGAPKIDTLVARIIPEPTTAVAEFESNAVDLLFIPEDQTRIWNDDAAKKALTQSAAALRLWYLGINTTRGPLKDVRVRQAIAHAIDVKTIIAQLINGRGIQAAGVIPPSLEGADASRTPLAYDTVQARKLLADAGLPGGIDIELWSSQTPPSPRLAETIQAYLRVVGIRAKIVQREAAATRAAARAGQTDIVLKDWFADYPDAENFLYPLLHTDNKGAGGNVSFFSNATFDAIVNQARVERDDSKRASLYKQADSLAYNQVGLMPLFFYENVFALQPWVHGFKVPVISNAQRWTGVTLGNEQK